MVGRRFYRDILPSHMEATLINERTAGDGVPRLLLVDDSAAQLKILGAVLSVLKLHVEQTLSGGEAFGLLLASRFDLLITDWNMSPISGAQLLAAMQLLPVERRPRVIICTADANLREVMNQSDVILAKPISAENLLTAVTTLLPDVQRFYS